MRRTSAIMAILLAAMFSAAFLVDLYYRHRLGDDLFVWQDIALIIEVCVLVLGAGFAFRHDMRYLIAAWAWQIALSLRAMLMFVPPSPVPKSIQHNPNLVSLFQHANDMDWKLHHYSAAFYLVISIVGIVLAFMASSKQTVH